MTADLFILYISANVDCAMDANIAHCTRKLQDEGYIRRWACGFVL